MAWLDFVIGHFVPERLIVRFKEERNVAGLVRLLERGEPYIRHLAAGALGELEDPAALDALLAALAGPDGEGVRWRAAEGLARLGPPAVDGLSALTSSGDPDVRWKAIVALGDSGDPRAVPVLCACLADRDRFVRRRAVSALARFGPASLQTLLQALSDRDPLVREGAARALGQLGDPGAIDGLIEALNDPVESVRRAVAASLITLNPEG
ncbi:MAG: HEAT repeat domain-containing protein [Methanospirillum sp.]|nr:HEAT repeat domain-containing protein [Methanospirillum sp.]